MCIRDRNTLIIAECEARVGALPNAVKAVNSIRVNAGLNDMNSGDVSDKNKVITEILTQKHLSLFLEGQTYTCLLYTSPRQRDRTRYRMPSSA